MSEQIAIVMATRNGARFISDQLTSLIAQSLTSWRLIVSDDGSTDETLDIIRDAVPAERLDIVRGPQRGVAANFLNGLRHVPDGHAAAFCDQDDVWLPDKLDRAAEWLSEYMKPAFLTTARWISDETLSTRRLQSRKKAPFSSLLLRARAAGNTMVLNSEGVTLLNSVAPHRDPAFHDWWASLVLTSAGATWLHDPEPSLMYRQHSNAVLGARGGRIHCILSGMYGNWIRQNIDALASAQSVMTPDAKRHLDKVTDAVSQGQSVARLMSYGSMQKYLFAKCVRI